MFQPKAKVDPSGLLAPVIDAAKEAGAMLRAEFHRAGGPRGQGGHAPIDREVELYLKDRLRALLPCSWIGEETDEIEVGSDEIWVVDPLDGTADFLAGRRGPALSVALLRVGRPVLGVVYAPTAPDDRGDLISWAEGAALTRNGLLVTPGLSEALRQRPGGESIDLEIYQFLQLRTPALQS